MELKMNPDIVARIEKLMKEDQLSNWEHNFLESLTLWVEKGRGISHRQNTTLQNIESKYSDDKKAALKMWKENFTPEMYENMIIMAHYYINNPPYFGDLARQVLSDSDKTFVPPEKAYRAMCENKYATRVIEIVKGTPLFEAGTMASIRANASGNATRFQNKMVMVLEHDTSKVVSAAKDARPVHVIPVGAAKSFWTEERYLKKVKKTG
tara:strand:+ start:262 stop:888 length:627 start_codon:yes stop_codon:yes gene_type:complete